jgi:penicillin-binding protein-related factor A (putative recombinase)
MKTWQDVEKDFAEHFNNQGKGCYVHRFTDTKEIRASTGGRGLTKAQPSDFLVVAHGLTFFAEVKHCADTTSFPFSALRTGQTVAGRRVLAAGGAYFVFVYAATLQRWFKIPFETIRATTEKKSIRWTDLNQHEWNI